MGKAAVAGSLTRALTNINLTHMGTILPNMLARAGCSTAITEESVILSRTALGSFCELWLQPAQLGAAGVDRLCNTVTIASAMKKNSPKSFRNGAAK